jgi:hypothetical protein
MTVTTPQPKPFARWQATLLLGIAVLLAAGTIYWLNTHTPSHAARLAPIIIAGDPGTIVQARGFTLRVPAAPVFETGHRLVVPGNSGRSPPQELPSHGLWLSVPVVQQVTLDGGSITTYLIDQQGRSYSAYARSWAAPGGPFDHRGERGFQHEINLAGKPLAPGFPETGRLYFELPAEALHGLHLRAHLGRVMRPNDNELDIDLKITPDHADTLQQQAADSLRTFAVREATR